MRVLIYVVLWLPVLGVMSYEHEDMYEMEKALETLTKQNQELQKQMSTITSGLTEICRAVNLATCDCADQQTGSEQRSIGISEELILISLASHGTVNDTVKLTLQFEATNEYSMSWLQTFIGGSGNVRTTGNVKATRLINDRTIFTSDVQLHDFNSTHFLLARFHSMTYTASILINLTAIVEEGEQSFNETEYKVTKYPRQVLLPKDLPEEYNVSLQVGRNILELVEQRHPSSSNMRPQIYLTVINTTSTPNAVSEVYSHNGIGVSQNDNGKGDIEIILTLQREHIENGGLLFFSIPQPGGRYAEVTHFGVRIEIIRDDLTSSVPPGTIALYHSPENVFVSSSIVSVFCGAMGNPKPDVTVYKERNGKLKKLSSEPLIIDSVTNFRTVSLRRSEKESKALLGTYVCEATNGNETIKTKTTLLRYKGIKFDERKTGVTLNTTEKVVVSCKVTGIPTPQLELRLGTNYGPNLLEAEGNFTHKTTTRNGLSKVVITFTPPDDRFDVLFCFAFQRGHNLYVSNDEEIRLFPSRSDWNDDYWSFHESFRQPHSEVEL